MKLSDHVDHLRALIEKTYDNAFARLRIGKSKLVDKTHINFFVEWGYLGMFNPSARVDSAMYILNKQKSEEESSFIKLNELYEGKRYDAFVQALDDYISGTENEHNYSIPQSKLKIIKSWPFIYWISDEFREKFKSECLEQYLVAGQGLASANNDRFLRFWWEVGHPLISKEKSDGLKWYMYTKGGPFNKWYGNNWITVNWENNGTEIKGFCDKNGKQRSVIRNEHLYLREGMSYAKAGSKGASFRYMPSHFIFDTALAKTSPPCRKRK